MRDRSIHQWVDERALRRQVLDREIHELPRLAPIGRIEILHCIQPALLQHRSLMREGLETEVAVVTPCTARADATERKMRVAEVDQGRIHAGATSCRIG